MFRRDKSGGDLQTLVGPAVTVHGDVEFAGGMHVEGRVLGRLRLKAGSEGALSMTATAEVEGDVEATHANLDG
ncbi:MAG: polymer-forming cytoskeletal protein, partial [Steroidobacteraceae bacterium]